MDAYAKCGQINECLRLWDELIESKIDFDLRVCGSLLNILAQEGRQKEMIDVLRQMHILCMPIDHGIIVSLAALARPVDRILTERLTYQGVKPAAAMLGLRLEGVDMDDEGYILTAPDSTATELSSACGWQNAAWRTQMILLL